MFIKNTIPSAVVLQSLYQVTQASIIFIPGHGEKSAKRKPDPLRKCLMCSVVRPNSENRQIMRQFLIREFFSEYFDMDIIEGTICRFCCRKIKSLRTKLKEIKKCLIKNVRSYKPRKTTVEDKRKVAGLNSTKSKNNSLRIEWPEDDLSIEKIEKATKYVQLKNDIREGLGSFSLRPMQDKEESTDWPDEDENLCHTQDTTNKSPKNIQGKTDRPSAMESDSPQRDDQTANVHEYV